MMMIFIATILIGVGGLFLVMAGIGIEQDKDKKEDRALVVCLIFLGLLMAHIGAWVMP